MPTSAPTPTATLLSATLPPTETAEPTLTPIVEATATPRPTRTPRSIATATPPTRFYGEVLEDGWVRYRVPQSYLAIELPPQLFGIPLRAEVLDEVYDTPSTAPIELLPRGYLRTLQQDFVQFYSADATLESTVYVVAQDVGDVPFEEALETRYAQLRRFFPDVAEPEPTTIAGVEGARAEYRLTILNTQSGERFTYGIQYYLLVDGYLHIVWASYPETDSALDAPLIDEIIERVTILEEFVP